MPAPPKRGQLWIILGVVAAAVVVVIVVGAVLAFKLLNRDSVPPATGQSVNTSFVQLRLTGDWKISKQQNSELDLANPGDGEMLVGYGNSSSDGIYSNQSAFSNLKHNLQSSTGGSVSQCLPQSSVTIGGKPGQEEGFRYNLEGQSLCEIAWVYYLSSNRYYYWNSADDSTNVSALQKSVTAMQETASWKI
ncbi:MAG: hypothetical protein ACREQM_19300 [Candidatus Dormibacteraceae bacterium]